MRRKSLLELAKRLRNSTGGGSGGGSPKSIKSSADDDEELDENGNIVTQAKRQSKTITTNPRKSLTFAPSHTEVPPPPSPPPRDKQHHKSQFEVNKRRNSRRRSSANHNDVTANKSNDLNDTHDADTSRPTKRRQYESEEKRQVDARESLVTSTASCGDAESPEDKKSWAKTTRQLQRMTINELESFLNVDDDFVLDCLIDQKPIIKRLERERDDIRKQVSNLANFNYAREPEFVRDRLKLREITDDVARMVRHTTGKYLEPILDKINNIQNRLARDARACEESSEAMANKLLTSGKPYDEFIKEYVCLRKETSKKRTLADRLAKERDLLMSNILYKSPLLANNNNNNNNANNNNNNGNCNNSTSAKHVTDDADHDDMTIATSVSSTSSTPSTW